MSIFKRTVALALSLLCVSFCLFSLCACADEPSDTHGVDADKKQDFLSMELDEIKKYIEIGKYKNLDIATGGENRDGAIWSAVESNFAVKEYPQAQLSYYQGQLEAEYRYRAEKDKKSDDEIEAMLKGAQENILAEAKELTKSDLVYAAIVKIENISVSEEEKTRLFDKYVEKYVSTYGYGIEYVKENMSDEIYSSMLYDKTTEFLLTNNNVK